MQIIFHLLTLTTYFYLQYAFINNLHIMLKTIKCRVNSIIEILFQQHILRVNSVKESIGKP